VAYRGKIAGDEIKFTRTVADSITEEMVAKRVNQPSAKYSVASFDMTTTLLTCERTTDWLLPSISPYKFGCRVRDTCIEGGELHSFAGG